MSKKQLQQIRRTRGGSRGALQLPGAPLGAKVPGGASQGAFRKLQCTLQCLRSEVEGLGSLGFTASGLGPRVLWPG
eukprot:8211490-Pyramimonas_sp.AAC.1